MKIFLHFHDVISKFLIEWYYIKIFITYTKYFRSRQFYHLTSKQSWHFYLFNILFYEIQFSLFRILKILSFLHFHLTFYALCFILLSTVFKIYVFFVNLFSFRFCNFFKFYIILKFFITFKKIRKTVIHTINTDFIDVFCFSF